MTEEERQDRAIEYVLGQMDPSAERVFEAKLTNDAELAELVADLRECVGALAHGVPLHLPPAHLRGKVLDSIRAENQIATIAPPAGPKRSWVPWATAAALALCCTLLVADRARLRQNLAGWKQRSEQWQEAAATHRSEAAAAEEAAKALDERAAALQKRGAAIEAELAQSKSRDALAQITIATLAAQLDTIKAAAVVLWDEQKQRGVIQVDKLPRPATGRDYQLWAIDPRYPAPVSAGILTVAENGVARVDFQPQQRIAAGAKFAISVEPAGGSPSPAGPIILAGP